MRLRCGREVVGATLIFPAPSSFRLDIWILERQLMGASIKERQPQICLFIPRAHDDSTLSVSRF
jgi:hypothetical protein